MRKKPDLIVGTTYTRWTILEPAPKGPKGAMWLCQCLCGIKRVIRADQLRGGQSKSCGCLSVDTARELMKTRSKTHGKAGTKIYKSWVQMVQRCVNPKDDDFGEYGARGITVCDEWRDFANFYRDMGDKPTPSHSLDRRDNAKGYSPENCRWATPIEQANNRRNSVFYTIGDRSMTLSMWAREYGLKPDVVFKRFKLRGWTLEKALTHPLASHTSEQ